jgi:hypothetical protein
LDQFENVVQTSSPPQEILKVLRTEELLGDLEPRYAAALMKVVVKAAEDASQRFLVMLRQARSAHQDAPCHPEIAAAERKLMAAEKESQILGGEPSSAFEEVSAAIAVCEADTAKRERRRGAGTQPPAARK